MGLFLVKKGFGLANYIDCRGGSRGGDALTSDGALQLGNEAIERAIYIFDEVTVYCCGDVITEVLWSCCVCSQINALGNKAEAIMTKAVLCRYDFNFQIKVRSDSI